MTLSILLFGIGASEGLLIVLAIVFLFGGKKIPELMRGLGTGIREFNEAKDKVKSEINEGMKAPKKTAEPLQENSKENSN